MSTTPIVFLPFGAVIQHLRVGPRNIDIVQGFDKQEQYVEYNTPHFGETIGRVANRISNAKINDLNGKSYTLAENDPPNTLHGGNVGWGKKIWTGPLSGGVEEIDLKLGDLTLGGADVEKQRIGFSLLSENGDENFPGTVKVEVFYTVGTRKTEEGKVVQVLDIEYQAKLEDEIAGVEVRETVINITNHSYFNLSGQPTIEGTEIKLSTNTYLPLENGIPISTETASFPNITPNEAFTLGPVNPDIDDCFIVSPSDTIPIDTRKSPLNKVAEAYHPETKIHLHVSTTEPAFQFYTGKHIDVPEILGEDGTVEKEARGSRAGFCVEPSRYVNAINVPEWKEQVVLKRGEVYGSRIVFEAWSDEEEEGDKKA